MVFWFGGARPAQAAGVSRADGIRLLDETRRSVDRTLELIKAGRADQAFAEARDGYLTISSRSRSRCGWPTTA